MEDAAVFEQTFKNIDDILHKDAGCTSELDYTEQSSWLLFLKYLDALETDKAAEAELEGRRYARILDAPYRWTAWAAPRAAAPTSERPWARWPCATALVVRRPPCRLRRLLLLRPPPRAARRARARGPRTHVPSGTAPAARAALARLQPASWPPKRAHRDALVAPSAQPRPPPAPPIVLRP